MELKNLFIGAFIVTMTSTVAAADGVEVVIDKGHVKVEWADLRVPYEVEYQIPTQCPNTQVDLSKGDSKLSATHKGAECSEGTKFTIRLLKSLNASIDLKAGLLQVANLRPVLSSLESLQAHVDAGNISSDVPQIRPVRGPDWASMAVNYQKDGVDGISIHIKMKSGSINL